MGNSEEAHDARGPQRIEDATVPRLFPFPCAPGLAPVSGLDPSATASPGSWRDTNAGLMMHRSVAFRMATFFPSRVIASAPRMFQGGRGRARWVVAPYVYGGGVRALNSAHVPKRLGAVSVGD